MSHRKEYFRNLRRTRNEELNNLRYKVKFQRKMIKKTNNDIVIMRNQLIESFDLLSNYYFKTIELNDKSLENNLIIDTQLREIEDLKLNLDELKEENIELKEKLYEIRAENKESRRINKRNELNAEIKVLKNDNNVLKSTNEALQNTIIELQSKWKFSIKNYKDNQAALSHWITIKDYSLFLKIVKDVEQFVYNHGGLNAVIREKDQVEEKKSKKRISNITPGFEDLTAMVLIRSRRGLKLTTLAFLYNLSVSWVDQLINAILPIVLQSIRDNIGYLTREQLKEVIPYTFRVHFPNVVLLLDCTYVYIEHSKNFALQYSTFSKHKYRNLVKFLVICYPNGRIADVQGPFGVDDDDYITKFVVQNTELGKWLKPNDEIIVDRGFQLGSFLQETYGVGFHQPAYLHGRKQFTTSEVEFSRICASARTVIENDNARIKSQRLLHYPYSNKMLPKIKEWFLLAASISNLCYNPFRTEVEGPKDLPIFQQNQTWFEQNGIATTISIPVGSRWSSNEQGFARFPLIDLKWIEKRCETPSVSLQKKINFRKR